MGNAAVMSLLCVTLDNDMSGQSVVRILGGGGLRKDSINRHSIAGLV